MYQTACRVAHVHILQKPLLHAFLCIQVNTQPANGKHFDAKRWQDFSAISAYYGLSGHDMCFECFPYIMLLIAFRGFLFKCWRSKQVAWHEDSASLWPSASCGISSLAPNRHCAGGPAKTGAVTYSNKSNRCMHILVERERDIYIYIYIHNIYTSILHFYQSLRNPYAITCIPCHSISFHLIPSYSWIYCCGLQLLNL